MMELPDCSAWQAGIIGRVSSGCIGALTEGPG